MPSREEHVVLVAKLAHVAEMKSHRSLAEVLDLMTGHHFMLEQHVNEDLAGRMFVFGQCDESALLLCQAEDAVQAVDVALKLVEQVEALGHFETQVGLACGTENWTPGGASWRPTVFGSGATAARQLAEIARPGQVVATEGVRQLVESQGSADGPDWGEPLETRLQGLDRPVLIASVAREDPSEVCHLAALDADLSRLSGMLANLMMMLTSVMIVGEQFKASGDTAALKTLKERLVHLTLSRGPLDVFEAAVQSSAQVRRIPGMLASTLGLREHCQVMRETLTEREDDLLESRDSEPFRRAVYRLLSPAADLDGARVLLQNTIFRELEAHVEKAAA